MKIIAVAAIAALLSLPGLAQSPDRSAGRQHVFPLIMDGDGFRSRLILNNAAASANQCALVLQGGQDQGEPLDTSRLQANDALTADGANATISLPAGGAGVTLATTGESGFAYGYALLDCEQNVIARLLLTLDDAANPGSPLALAASGGAPVGSDFIFPLQRQSADFALVFANPGASTANCSHLFDEQADTGAGGENLTVPPGSTVFEFPVAAEQFPGSSVILASCDSDVAAIGIPFEGQVFSAVLPFSPDADNSESGNPVLPLIVDGSGFRSRLLLANPTGAATSCALTLRGQGLDESRFELPDGVTPTSAGLLMNLESGGELQWLTSKGEGSLVLGHASIDCEQPVLASNTLSLELGGILAGMATIPGSQKASAFQVPVIPESGRLALATSNDSSSDVSCGLELTDYGGANFGLAAFQVEPASTTVQFLDELFLLPENFSGGEATVSCDQPVEAVALPLSGAAFAALSPAILAAETLTPEPGLIFNPADFPPISIFRLDETITPLQLPEPLNGEPPFSYTLEPPIPGLRFDPVTRRLSGTPTEAGEYLLRYQARDASGKSGLYPVFILVRGPDSEPGFADDSALPDQNYTLGREIETLQFPEATGGNPPLVYFLSSEVPGLTFDIPTRQLSGAPERTGVYPISYNVTDADFDMDSLEFTITVTVPESARTPLEAGRCADGGFVENPSENSGLVADCQALVSFANALIETGLIMEDNVLNQWGGEGQVQVGSWSGVGTSEARVSSLELPFSSLKGDLPAAAGELEALTRLDLRGNELSGGIPPEIGNLSRLETLDLSANRLSGSVPAELAKLENLRNLSLAINELSGPIPPGLGALGKLESLSLMENELSGTIPAELGQLANLRELNLAANQFASSIPSSLGQLGKLTTLQLFANELTGAIPPELGQLENLEKLVLGFNELGGAIPAELAMLRKLQQLVLSMNRLSGPIPPDLGELSALVMLDLRFNALEGNIPVELAGLENLRDLYVSFNQLRGTVDWAFRERIAEGNLLLETEGNRITGLAPPPEREPAPAEPPESPVNASHHSIAWYQGPLLMEWNWQGERVEHQTPILGRWALLAVRVNHATEQPPEVITRVLDAEDKMLVESLAEAAPPTTEAIEPGQFRSEFLFYLPGRMYQSGNQIVHVIDPENALNESDESDNIAEPIVLHGEQPPRFRAVFIPLLMPDEKQWHKDFDPNALMAGALAFLPIADDFEARFGPTLEFDAREIDDPLIDVFELWNAEAEPDEFYHGIVNHETGGVAVLGSQVAVSELSIHRVIPHEFGHNLTLEHTPGCHAEGVDGDYPYPDGKLGPDPAWERNWRLFASGDDEAYTDLMSYCTELKLISDYNYRRAAEYWLAFGTQTNTSPVTSGPAPQSLAAARTGNEGSIALSGRISAGGAWSLTQASQSTRQPRPPADNGEYALLLFDAAGVQVHAEPLALLPLSHGEETFWAARIPIPLREPEEIVILDAQGNEMLRQTLPEM